MLLVVGISSCIRAEGPEIISGPIQDSNPRRPQTPQVQKSRSPPAQPNAIKPPGPGASEKELNEYEAKQLNRLQDGVDYVSRQLGGQSRD